jgi:hypothetical protein
MALWVKSSPQRFLDGPSLGGKAKVELPNTQL